MSIECFIPVPQDESGHSGWAPCVIQGRRSWTIYNELHEREYSVTDLSQLRLSFVGASFAVVNNQIVTDLEAFRAKYPGYRPYINAYIQVDAPPEFKKRSPIVPLQLFIRCPVNGVVQRTFFVKCDGPPRSLSQEEYRQLLSTQTNKRQREADLPD